MGPGTAIHRLSFLFALLLLAAITHAVTACPVNKPAQPIERSGVSVQRLATLADDPAWPKDGTLKAYA